MGQETYKTLRFLQLYVQVLNIINRYVIFTWKVLCLGVSIFCGYAAIAHFAQHPVFGIMYYVLFITATMDYTIIYERAFKTQALFKQVVSVAMTQTLMAMDRKSVRHIWTNKILTRQFRSIPSLGIKVGEFHMMQRTSTPAFLDFVLTHIVSMLMAFA